MWSTHHPNQWKRMAEENLLNPQCWTMKPENLSCRYVGLLCGCIVIYSTSKQCTFVRSLFGCFLRCLPLTFTCWETLLFCDNLVERTNAEERWYFWSFGQAFTGLPRWDSSNFGTLPATWCCQGCQCQPTDGRSMEWNLACSSAKRKINNKAVLVVDFWLWMWLTGIEVRGVYDTTRPCVFKCKYPFQWRLLARYCIVSYVCAV